VWCVCVDFICLEHLFFGLGFFLKGFLGGYWMWLFRDFFFPQGILMLGFEWWMWLGSGCMYLGGLVSII